MSSNPTLVTERHFEYIAERTAGDDEFLRSLKAAALRAGIPPIWISPVQANFIRILLKICGAREVVEVGTLAGYSAIWMARALPEGGRVRTIEIREDHAEFAGKWIGKSDVADRIELIRGAGKDVLATFEDGSADAAFLDADKASYPVYLKECMRIVRPGGLILADNAFAFGELFEEHPKDREVQAIRDFNEIMARTPGLEGIIVPLGDGLWVALRS